MQRFLYLAVVILALAGWLYTSGQIGSVSLGPGVKAPEKPFQTSARSGKFSFEGYQITPLAEFQITGKVLARSNYFLGREADLSPVDLAMGWGRMSDEAVLEQLKITQSGRWYYWKTKDQYPIPRREIETHSANMHMIPGNSRVKAKLKRVKKGMVVSITGKLVQVDGEDGWRWVSSTTRQDTGGGACEVIFIEELSIVERG